MAPSWRVADTQLLLCLRARALHRHFLCRRWKLYESRQCTERNPCCQNVTACYPIIADWLAGTAGNFQQEFQLPKLPSSVADLQIHRWNW
jgi:hypothetical protein